MARFNTEVAEFSEDTEVAGKRATCVVAMLRVLGELGDLRVKAGVAPPTIRRAFAHGTNGYGATVMPC